MFYLGRGINMELDSNGVSIEQPIIQQDNYESYFRDEI